MADNDNEKDRRVLLLCDKYDRDAIDFANALKNDALNECYNEFKLGLFVFPINNEKTRFNVNHDIHKFSAVTFIISFSSIFIWESLGCSNFIWLVDYISCLRSEPKVSVLLIFRDLHRDLWLFEYYKLEEKFDIISGLDVSFIPVTTVSLPEHISLPSSLQINWVDLSGDQKNTGLHNVIVNILNGLYFPKENVLKSTQDKVLIDMPGSDLSLCKFMINPDDIDSTIEICPEFNVSVHSPLPFAGSAAILTAISAGETPALPGGSERLQFNQVNTGSGILRKINLKKMPIQTRALGVKNRDIAALREFGVAVKGDSEVAGNRFVSAGIEEDEWPLQVGVQYTFYVSIGKKREGAIGGGVFIEPNWGNLTELELFIVVNGEGLDLTQNVKKATLKKTMEDVTVNFNISPRVAGFLVVYISIYLAKKITLLQEYKVILEVNKT